MQFGWLTFMNCSMALEDSELERNRVFGSAVRVKTRRGRLGLIRRGREIKTTFDIQQHSKLNCNRRAAAKKYDPSLLYFLHQNAHLILKVWGIKCIDSGLMALWHPGSSIWGQKQRKDATAALAVPHEQHQSNTEAFTETLIRDIMMLDGNLQAWNTASLNESKAINAVCRKCPLCACAHGSGSWPGASVLHLCMLSILFDLSLSAKNCSALETQSTQGQADLAATSLKSL